MSDPFIGEVMLTGFNWAPNDYALCDGTTMSVSQHTALFSLIGIQFGGNGRTDFNLPDMRGRVPIGVAASESPIGTQSGYERIVLTTKNTGHGHSFHGSQNQGTTHLPFNPATGDGNYLASSPAAQPVYHFSGTLTSIAQGHISLEGQGQSHNNMQPYLVINFCMALGGTYPSRN